MATTAEALAVALEHHQAGRLSDAEAIYRQIVEAEPNHADAWHLLGVIAHQAGQFETAIEYIGRAIALNGNDGAFPSNLGEVYRARRMFSEAIASYRRALELSPHLADGVPGTGYGTI
jgi:protein O-GlcNAc transferase